MNLSQFVEQAVFVFGSNRQGIHGAGVAWFASRYRGAQAGQGEGLHGTSYALPTKYTPYDTVPDFDLLRESVARFLDFAQARPWLSFMVTRVGCGLAGFTDAQVVTLFAQAPANWTEKAYSGWMPSRCRLPWQKNRHHPCKNTTGD